MDQLKLIIFIHKLPRQNLLFLDAKFYFFIAFLKDGASPRTHRKTLKSTNFENRCSPNRAPKIGGNLHKEGKRFTLFNRIYIVNFNLIALLIRIFSCNHFYRFGHGH